MRERERIHSIVDEMEAEDHAAMEMEEHEGSSDDEPLECYDRVHQERSSLYTKIGSKGMYLNFIC